MSYKSEFIAFMAKAGVLTFGDFTTKSGRKTPYFINTGNYKTGAQIARLGEFYAACIEEHIASGDIPADITALFGPAYKGIPLAVSAASALYRTGGKDLFYCFNRKEVKDHGEGGSMVGYKPQDGDKILIIEDVITAGTAVRETLPVLLSAAKVEVPGLVISVDRMEKGQGELTAIEEIERDFGIRTFPIVTVKDILESLYNKEVDGRVYIDDAMRERMEAYMATYCVKR
ncbi:MAG: orotate phosphoribosyltransferase [Clostridia bacterium]|nr:orotate phosphoribosyltransferase [Clostridia bacterium]MBQ6693192.1 orotate phosphoribosyltransferase [Clostridia bacterium]MBQ7113903.1 orotate phosphoribosyltransferase [Clostridia bacterium]